MISGSQLPSALLLFLRSFENYFVLGDIFIYFGIDKVARKPDSFGDHNQESRFLDFESFVFFFFLSDLPDLDSIREAVCACFLL